MEQAHIVLHTHWDREWYFTTHDSLVLLDQAFTEILDTLHKNELLKFTMDGQISIVQEYLSIRPDKKVLMDKLVQEGRLQVGPWFTQTDTFYVNGYSIVNNLYVGIEDTVRLFGTYMKIAYLPDTFGFSHQLPMIANRMGINNGIIWRGVDFNKQNIEPYFNWQGQNQNVTMHTAILHGGYGAFKKANADAIFIKEKIDGLAKEIDEMTAQSHILMPVGNDQHNIVADIIETAKAYGPEYKVSSYEKFFEQFNPDLAPQYDGEFRETSYARVHRSSGGVRVNIKKSNYEAEQQLLRRTSPLVAMARTLELDISDLIIWKAWKKLFEGQAHDGIVGCVSEAVAADIINRNKQALELGVSQENMIKKMIATKIGLTEKQILILNTGGQEIQKNEKIQVFSHHPAVTLEGVENVSLIHSEFFPGNPEALVEKPEGNYIEVEKDYYLHTLLVETTLPAYGYMTFNIVPIQPMETTSLNSIRNEKGTFEIVNSKISYTTKEHHYDDFIKIVDQGNAGDTYDFSPVEKVNQDLIYFSLLEDSVQFEQKNNYQQLTCSFHAQVPNNLEERAQQKHPQTMQADVSIELWGDDAPRIQVTVHNNVLNHNLRIAFQTLGEAKESIAQSEFGYITRNILKDKNIEGWEKDNIEYPIDIHPNSGFVGVKRDSSRGTYVLNKGVKEYQVIEDYIYFTCFSSTDELGKPNLAFRPGRASGDISKKGHIQMFTPSAQVLGQHTFDFQFIETPDILETKQAFELFEQPSIFYQKQAINLFYERIDNKIDLLDNKNDLDANYSMDFNVDQRLYTSLLTSYIDGEIIYRVYSFEPIIISDEMKNTFIIGNLLEQPENINTIEPFTLYTLRRR